MLAISNGKNKDIGPKDVYEAKAKMIGLKHYGETLKTTLGKYLHFKSP